MMGLGVENDIDELEEDHSQQLTAEKFTELHCVSQQDVVEEILSEEEEATVKQQSFGAITEILKAWEAAALPQTECAVTTLYFNANSSAATFWCGTSEPFIVILIFIQTRNFAAGLTRTHNNESNSCDITTRHAI
ncbi:hypothetical protein AVEN_4376-1 [Araneus ventricosus]|uniref:Uncharacterized protein n=1 Tax=Araneus ventricosus TaxID=182803 RepID=A0A4Y2MLE3_ARAVE|nr:hypothetical protein AVEN_259440-1 [Araneus ventricosus]GBN27991.1 hypothetical protein AVEN_4376-1 [Araneus ventricosus]